MKLWKKTGQMTEMATDYAPKGEMRRITNRIVRAQLQPSRTVRAVKCPECGKTWYAEKQDLSKGQISRVCVDCPVMKEATHEASQDDQTR